MRRIQFTAWPAALLMCLLLPALVAAAPAEPTVASRLAEALQLYNDLEFDQGIAIARDLMTHENLTAQDSVAVLEVLSILTYVKGQQFQQESFQYLEKISKIGPCLTPMPQDFWPQELRNKWYRMVQEQKALTCDHDPNLKTIAIMEFDNFSAGKYQEELGLLSKGLADFFEHDFRKISELKVIERDKIPIVLEELKLQQTAAVDQSTAVQVGKVLGAKYMVFGSISQLDDNLARMVVRVVNVETSEIVASVDKEGKPKYSEMEKELVKELAASLDVKLGKETLGKIEEGGTDLQDATAFYSLGLKYMDEYDYKLAYENFRKAFELDPNFTEAKRKMEIYGPLAGKAS